MGWAALRHRIGHRGAFLVCLGAYDLFFGLYLVAGGALQYVPLIGERTWGIVWMSIGAFLCAGALTRHDAPFFAAAILIKIVWALETFRLDWFNHDADYWIRGCYWLALCAAIITVANWPEPTRIIKPPDPRPSAAERRAHRA